MCCYAREGGAGDLIDNDNDEGTKRYSTKLVKLLIMSVFVPLRDHPDIPSLGIPKEGKVG